MCHVVHVAAQPHETTSTRIVPSEEVVEIAEGETEIDVAVKDEIVGSCGED